MSPVSKEEVEALLAKGRRLRAKAAETDKVTDELIEEAQTSERIGKMMTRGRELMAQIRSKKLRDLEQGEAREIDSDTRELGQIEREADEAEAALPKDGENSELEKKGNK
jgi:hypothetical protein